MSQQTSGRRRWAVVLAGGDGTRLQEFTREITGSPIPKQYCRIMGRHSLLETTLTRTQEFTSLEHTLVVVTSTHLDVARQQLRPLPAANVLVQPCNRDTGPGLMFALLALIQRDPNAVVAVFPSDHYVSDDRIFMEHVLHGIEVVTQLPEKILILGIRPDRPEPGYGYIVPGGPLTQLKGNGVTFEVERFCEKPTMEIASGLLDQGGLWNSFVMVFQVARMIALIRAVVEAEFDQMWPLHDFPTRLDDVYRDLRPWNFSHRFLARIPQHLAVLRVDDVHWSDWGTRDSIERTLKRLSETAALRNTVALAASV